ncbi:MULTISPECIES: helix-turn-helix domain-containing protein [Streptomyces]|uniref:helix-turn-helix domain-containing protein n=1 Tax=Streptomyces TaxID=1883 RepID=UPI0013DD2B65|nr:MULTISPECIES: helix-turn-helix domain-containing protein [Streptomyces]KAF2779938.1 AraC family transcriptional regulator [Streptomyces sp. OM5714]MDI6517472.1 helix-turn-helix domain-containing protein [Streptomyces coelicoflavus]
MPVTHLGTVVAENAIRFLGHDTHQHDEPHLIYVVTGSALLTADGGEWRLGRQEAVWLAPRVPHALRIAGGGMALGPTLNPGDLPRCRVQPLGAVPAVIEVMTTALGAAPGTAEQVRPFRQALGRVLRNLSRPYFPVVLPTHPAVRALARDALRTPAATLERLAAQHRMSPRQVQRIFLDETGLPFTRWRSRARMNAAVEHVLGGGELTAAARAAGYATRTGLLRALSRESGIPVGELTADPAGALGGRRAHPAPAPDHV